MATRQQFIFNNKTIGITTIQFKNTISLKGVEKIVFFKENKLSGNWLKKEFRYSFDNIVWTSWRTFTQNNVTSIEFNDQPEFYIEILYTRANYNTADIGDIYLFYDSNEASPVDPSTALVDATTLQGQPGSYYLNRENFFGPYSGLKVENAGDASSAGVYYTRDDSSVGSTFYFKSIDGSGLINVTEDSSGKITIFADPSVLSGGVTYQNDTPTERAVGGIPKDTTYFLTEKTFAQVMQDMFYPLEVPSFTPPSNSLTDNVTPNLQEIGDTLSITLTSYFNRGSINPAYGTSGFRSGIPTSVDFSGPDVSIVYSSNPSSGKTHTFTYDVSKGYQTWLSSWTYEAGEQPKDSKGNDFGSPLPSGKTSYAPTQLEGVYPIYATTNSIISLDKQSLTSMELKEDVDIDMVAEPPFGTARQKFEIAQDWIHDSSILGIQNYNSLEQEWKYEGDSPAASLTKWTPSFAGTRIIGGESIPYVRYTYNNADKSGAVTIRLKFRL